MNPRFLLSALLLLISIRLSAQDSLHLAMRQDRQRQVLKTNLLPILWGPVILTSEYRIVAEAASAPWQSILFGLSYLGKSPFANLFLSSGSSNGKFGRETMIRGFRFQGMYRFYLTHEWKAPQGIYIGPHASYSYAKVMMVGRSSQYAQLNYSNINLLCGAQALIFRTVAIDLFAGVGYRANFIELRGVKGSITSNPIPGVLDGERPGHLKLTLGMNAGWAF